MGMRAKMKTEIDDLPETIGYRTKELAPLLIKWRRRNPLVPWSRLISQALKNELEPLATKREQHLLAA